VGIFCQVLQRLDYRWSYWRLLNAVGKTQVPTERSFCQNKTAVVLKKWLAKLLSMRKIEENCTPNPDDKSNGQY